MPVIVGCMNCTSLVLPSAHRYNTLKGKKGLRSNIQTFVCRVTSRQARSELMQGVIYTDFLIKLSIQTHTLRDR